MSRTRNDKSPKARKAPKQATLARKSTRKKPKDAILKSKSTPSPVAPKKPRAKDDPGFVAAKLGAQAALDKKADDVVIVDLTHHSSYADYLILCSGSNERQLEAIAEGVNRALKDHGRKSIGTEGVRGGRWVLLDFGDIVVHVFHGEDRSQYDIEGLWADAPQTKMADEAGGKAATK